MTFAHYEGSKELRFMEGLVEWAASVGSMVAAGLIAADIGRKVTGYAFILFCVVSLLWIYSGLTSDAMPIAVMNGVLLLINGWGVYRYLFREERPGKS